MAGSKVAILGMGLIGGSVALGLRAADPERDISAYDPSSRALDTAMERGALARRATSPADAVAGADLVILAMPVDRMAGSMEEISDAVSHACVVTDVGSSKAEIVSCGERSFGGRFIGGHPMAGSERHGMEAADAELFQGARWLLTPTDSTDESAYRALSEVAVQLGATPVALAPEDHDRVVARISHLPQLVASALVQSVAASEERPALLGLAAAGFRDTTRIAAGDADMWLAVLRTNRQAILECLESLALSWDEIGAWLRDERWEALHDFLTDASTSRRELFLKPDTAATSETLVMLIPDRPGVLAEVTTAAGELGANIEDLQIFHSTEGGRGRLEVVIAGEEKAAELAALLHALGYHVHRGLPT